MLVLSTLGNPWYRPTALVCRSVCLQETDAPVPLPGYRTAPPFCHRPLLFFGLSAPRRDGNPP